MCTLSRSSVGMCRRARARVCVWCTVCVCVCVLTLLHTQGVVPALIMVTNPTIQFILYEWLVARVRDIRRKRAQAAGTK